MPTPFSLQNTLTNRLEPFEPLEGGKVGLYVCGMTVYDHCHVGHARAMIVFDTFVRALRWLGWEVTFVRNITDVDDKIIRRAAEQGVSPAELAQSFIDAFHEDMAALELISPDHEPRVSTSIEAITGLIADLVERGHAYVEGGTVWFDVGSDPDYGKLSNNKGDQLQNADAGAGKRDARDFALWKAAKPGEPQWDSPWGAGRPGWHIECSAMAKATLGATFDIHGGGRDLVFPHHENEVAQSECGNGAPFARYWMHNGLLVMASGAKMGKSEGNAFQIRRALERFPAEAIKLYQLQVHYGSPIPWEGDPSLVDALGMLARLYEAREVAEAMGGSESADTVAEQLGEDAVEVLALGRAFPDRLRTALAEDFNTARALGHAFELARAINRFSNHKKAKKRGGPVVAPALAGLRELSAALGLLAHEVSDFHEEVKDKRLGAMGLSREQIEGKLAERTAARQAKDWARADALRAELDALGIVVMDRAEGVDWKLSFASAEGS